MINWGKAGTAAALILMTAGAAEAHTGTGAIQGLHAGLLHPVVGLDHLLAMVAVGLLGAQMGGRIGMAFPVLFLVGMVAGGALGLGHVVLPWTELMIGASGVALGLFVAGAWRGLMVPALAVTAVFGAVHGVAHGAELPAGASWSGYAAGFLLATALLHATGFGLVALAKRLAVRGLVRWGGGALALGSAALLSA